MALPTRPTRTAPAPDDTTTPHGSWLMLAVLLLGQFMCIIDVLVTNVAMPSIAASLHASGASLQLVVGGYTIAYAMLLITGARLGDRYGRRRAYLAGVLVFTAASLACALAPDSQALIGFRLVQGAGAAVLVPQVFSIIQLNFTGPARARALSAYAAVLSAGAVTGLVLGGVVVTANLFGTGWRPVFAINVPIGIALAAAVPRLVPPDETSRDASAAGRTKKLDLAGLATAACAVLLIVLPLVLGHQERWPAWCFACIAVGAVLAAGFVLIERRVAARGGDPLLNLAVLRAPALPSGLVTLAATQIGYGGLLFAYTLHLQAGLGESALRAGLSYLPFAAVFGLAGYNWRRLPAAVRRVLVPAGLTVGILAYLALAAGLHGAGLHGAGHGAARGHRRSHLGRPDRGGPRPGTVGQPAAHPVPHERARSPGSRRVRPAHHHRAARPAAGGSRHRLGLPVSRRLRFRVPHLHHGARGRLGRGHVRHGLLAGRPVRRRPGGRRGHGPGRPAPVIRKTLIPNGPSLTPSAAQLPSRPHSPHSRPTPSPQHSRPYHPESV